VFRFAFGLRGWVFRFAFGLRGSVFGFAFGYAVRCSGSSSAARETANNQPPLEKREPRTA